MLVAVTILILNHEFVKSVLQGGNGITFEILMMYSVGALIELFGEPWYNCFLSAGNYQPRLRAEV